MIGNWGNRMGVYDRIKVERRGGFKNFTGIDLEGVVIGSREEGQRIEWIEREMRDAEFVGGSGIAGFGTWLIGEAFEGILSAFEIPDQD
jgi:hypothetical protein